MGVPRGMRRQRGVALITAMLITALVTIVVTGMKSREAIDIRRATNIQFNEQAFYYLLGAEDWAGHILARDLRDSEYDNLAEDWARTLPPVSIDGGQIGGQLIDLQGRFNINNLSRALDAGDAEQDADDDKKSIDVIRFERLLVEHELPTSLVDAVLDWLDKDANVRFPDGAEDVDYLNREPPYRAANTLMADPSELLRVKGFNYEVYAKIAPYLVALPEPTKINVNTAVPGVLQMIVEDLSAEEAERLAESLESEPLETIEDFLNHPLVSDKKVDTPGLGMASEYFQLAAYAQVGDIRAQLNSILHRRSDTQIEIVQRSRNGSSL